MTRSALCGLCFVLTAAAANATPVVTVGTPGDSLLATPSKPSSQLGGTLLNFDSLTPFTSFSSYGASGVTISSPDGLEVLPYSTQSGPNELYDNSAAGSANITIRTNATSAIGFGIADSDPVSIVIQALGAGGVLLGAPIAESLPATESAVNTGNGYYVLRDTTSDIYGLQLTEVVGDANYSGLALDDVQVAPIPEPASASLLALGLSVVGLLGLTRQLKQA